jgi:hypothetical protein
MHKDQIQMTNPVVCHERFVLILQSIIIMKNWELYLKCLVANKIDVEQYLAAIKKSIILIIFCSRKLQLM